ATDSTCSIVGCTVTGNKATQRGAGIYCLNGAAPLISDCWIVGNTQNTTGRDFGGGIACVGGSNPTIVDCIIAGNVGRFGAGIGCIQSSPTVANCVISGNSAISTVIDGITGQPEGCGGGGVFAHDHSSPVLENCVISGNYARNWNGGALYCQGQSNPEVTNCTISSNHADHTLTGNLWSGVVVNTDSDPVFVNCIFEGMTSYAVYEEDATSDPAVSYSLFFDNGTYDYRDENANNYTGGDAINANVAEANGNVAGNPNPLFQPGITGTWSNVSYLGVGSNTTRLTANGTPFTAGALVGRLVNADTSQKRHALIIANTANALDVVGDITTTTGLEGYADIGDAFAVLNYDLQAGSPAKDAGDPAGVPPAPETDIRGVSRPHYAGIDIGAYEYDDNAPSVLSISSRDPGPTNADSLVYDVLFSEHVVGVTLDAFFVTTIAGGNAVAVRDRLEGSGATYAVTLVNVTGNGDLRLDLVNIGGITDVLGHALPAGALGQVTTVDNDPPYVAAGPSLQGSPGANAPSVQFLVTFSEVTVGPDPSDFMVTVNATVEDVSPSVVNVDTYPVGGAGVEDQWLITVDTGDMEGDIGLQLLNDGTITDPAGNSLVAGSSSGQVHIVDTHAPRASAPALDGSPPLIAPSVQFIVSFSEVVGDITTADFQVDPVGTIDVAPSVSAVDTYPTGGGAEDAEWVVTVDTGSMEGTLGLTVLNSGPGSIVDMAGNELVASVSSGQVHSLDTIAPTAVAITHGYVGPTSTTPPNPESVDFTVTFSQAVVHFDDATEADFDFSASDPGVTHTGVTVLDSGDQTTYTVTVEGVAGDGDLRFAIATTSDVQDPAGNPLASSVLGDAIDIDNTPPVLTFGAPVLSPLNPNNKVNALGTITYYLTYQDAVAFNVGPADVQVLAAGNITGWNMPVVNDSANPVVIQLSGLTGNGTVQITVDAGTSEDIAGNIDTGPAAPSPSVTVDNAGPGVVIDTPIPEVANQSATVLFNIHFTDGVTHDLASIVLEHGGNIYVDPTIEILNHNTADPTVRLTNCSGDGWIHITVPSASAFDDLSNPNAATVSPDLIVDNTGPTVPTGNITHGYSGSTAATSVDFSVVFDEAVVNFETSGGNGGHDIEVDHSISHGWSTSHDGVTITQMDPQTYTVTLYGIQAYAPHFEGEFRIRVSKIAPADVVDLAGNPLFYSAWSPWLHFDPAVVGVNSITRNVTSPTNADAIEYTVVFSTDVENFDPTDLEFNETGTVAHTGVDVAPASGPEDVYTVTVSG
ncbi:MAG TPA: right-handed parallel beta-helix repeat-containing protein, partial [Candidatus Hydrogenedentes bacterium]|nr:right-handed parallel beta-helix repeat-containing protein [Candidatus Hydrogenedentota bacterium]